MGWRLALLTLAIGCGRIGFDAGGNGDSRLGDGSGTGDGTGASCVTWSAFGAPTLIGGVNSQQHEAGLWLSPDELTIYFNSDRVNGTTSDLYVATRADRQASFSTPVALAVVNGSADDKNPTLTADQLTLIFDSNRAGTYDLYTATRPSVGANFSAATLLQGLSDPVRIEVGPAMSGDGLTLYVTLRTPPNPQELWLATRANTASAFVLVRSINAELATSGDEGFASPSSDGHELFFESDPGGLLTVFRAHRADITGPFDPGTEVTQVTSTQGDDDPEISADGATLYFTSFRTAAFGFSNLFFTQRTCLD